MQIDQEFPLSNPRFECVVIEVRESEEGNAEVVVREVASRALQEIGEEFEQGWSIERVFMGPAGQYDLLPPPDREITVEHAWELTHVLRAETEVRDAEPGFEFVQDNFPEEGEEPSEETFLGRVMRRIEDAEAALEASAPVEGLAEAAPDGPPEVDEEDYEWSLKLIEADDLAARGSGVRVGHPDSGYVDHRELWDPDSGRSNRIRANLGKNLMEPGQPIVNEHGTHGLGTASVIMSFDNQPANRRYVHGIVPECELVPFRVARRRPVLPDPVLLSGGMRRLRDAIRHAINEPANCSVISISLGGFWHRTLHQALKDAFKKDVIVCAAAGNIVQLVVWPARYEETIAVAGCDHRRRIWVGSSRGSSVDVTAPAKNVWKATVGDPDVRKGKGTSFAVATVAGVAAAWLSRWGRDSLLDRYRGEFKLTTVFRKALTETCDPPPRFSFGLFGAGIVNARKLLERDPPTLEEMRASSEALIEALVGLPTAPSPAGLEFLTSVFDLVPAERVREKVSSLLPEPTIELEGAVTDFGDELAFHLLSNPFLRERILGVEQTAPELTAPLETEAAAREWKMDTNNVLAEFSSPLRRRLGLG